MKLVATRDIIKGEIIVQGGLSGSNADTLINTGFVNHGQLPCQYDCTIINITVKEDTPLYTLKMKLLDL